MGLCRVGLPQRTSLRPLVSLASPKGAGAPAALPRHSPIDGEGEGAAGEEGQRQEIPGSVKPDKKLRLNTEFPDNTLSLVSVVLSQCRGKRR